MTETTKNRILCSLSGETRDTVMRACETVELERREVLDHVGGATSYVYFPETAVISTLATYSDGAGIEMANVGREACTGVNLVLGYPRQLSTDEVQVRGTARRIGADAFVALQAALPEFERRLFSAVQAIFYHVMVSGACNGAHNTKQRLARWLLTMRDRSDAGTIDLTHDFLAEMLGVRRATVSEAAAELQSVRAISYARGRIVITDPAALRRASCECYELVRDGYDALLPEGQG